LFGLTLVIARAFAQTVVPFVLDGGLDECVTPYNSTT